MFCCYIPPVDLLLLVSQKAAFSSTAAQIPQNKKTLNSHIKKTILISWPDITGLHKLKGYIYIYTYMSNQVNIILVSQNRIFCWTYMYIAACMLTWISSITTVFQIKIVVFGLIPSTDVMQLTLTLKMTTAKVVEMSVTVNNNSPIQDYVDLDDHTQPTYETTPGFKPFTVVVLSVWSAWSSCPTTAGFHRT